MELIETSDGVAFQCLCEAVGSMKLDRDDPFWKREPGPLKVTLIIDCTEFKFSSIIERFDKEYDYCVEKRAQEIYKEKYSKQVDKVRQIVDDLVERFNDQRTNN